MDKIKKIFADYRFMRTDDGMIGTHKWVLKDWAEGLIGGLLLLDTILVILALCIALQ